MAWTYSLTYTPVNDYSFKDGLSSGQAEKIILGSDIDDELSGIQTALNSKLDAGSVSSTAEAQAGTDPESVMTPNNVTEWSNSTTAGGGHVGELWNLADPAADRILFYDFGAGAGSMLSQLAVTNGLEISGTNLQVAATLAGDGLAHTTGVLSVNVGEGIFLESDTVKLSDVSAGAAQPVVVTNGTFTFDLSSITTMAITDLDVSQDGIVMSDNGTIKVMPVDEAGVDVIETANDIQTFALTDANTYQVLTGIATADKDWTIPTEASVPFKIGTCILVMDRDGDGTYALDVLGETGVTITSSVLSASGSSSRHKIRPGGTGLFIKIATNEWAAMGDVADGN